MPCKRKASPIKGELEPRIQFTKFEEHKEILLPSYFELSNMRHKPNPSHAHPDVLLPSREFSSNYPPSSSPIERHVKRRSLISQDLLRAEFPRDEDGFIAQVQNALPGRDISPYAAHLRSGSSPVPYDSHDYGPRAASTPSQDISGPSEFEGLSESGDNDPEPSQEDAEQYEKFDDPDHGTSTMDGEEDGKDDCQNSRYGLEKSEETLPTRFFLDSSRFSWDRENSEPRRVPGRRPPPLPAPANGVTSSSPERSGYSQAQAKAQSQITSSKSTSVTLSTNLRGGLLEKIDDTIIDPQAYRLRGFRDPNPHYPPVILNFISLRTVGFTQASISKSRLTLWAFIHLYGISK